MKKKKINEIKGENTSAKKKKTKKPADIARISEDGKIGPHHSRKDEPRAGIYPTEVFKYNFNESLFRIFHAVNVLLFSR